MTYFQHIHSLADLKREYRRLAKENHPDRGGSTATMQAVNAEFSRLFALWKDDMSATQDSSGYESDYAGASARQYADYVYNEYRYRGSNYHEQSAPEIVEQIRKWLRETYPRYKFSVSRKNYNSLYIYLMQADFEPFVSGSKYKDTKEYYGRGRYDKEMTARANEVLAAVWDYAMSYNYDNSDAMTDYFDTNFYLTMGIGNYRKAYKVVVPKLSCRKGDEPPVFKYPEGAAHKAIRQALGGARFGAYDTRNGRLVVLGSDFYCSQQLHFGPKRYSSAAMAQKRMDKLTAAGIRCRLTGWNDGLIEFLGYTPETEQRLEAERAERIEAYTKWREKHPAAPKPAPEQIPQPETQTIQSE